MKGTVDMYITGRRLAGILAAVCGTLTASGAIAQTSPADLLPAEVRARGYIEAVTGHEVPPISTLSTDGVTLVGILPDMKPAIEKLLGVTINVTPMSQAAQISGIQSGRYEMAWYGGADSVEREKVLTYLDWIQEPLIVITNKGNPKNITDQNSLCGLKIGTVVSSSNRPKLEAVSEKCVAQNLAPIEVTPFAGFPEELPALAAGNIDGIWQLLSPGRAVEAAQPDNFEIAFNNMPNGIEPGYRGLNFPIDSPLIPAFEAAFTIYMQTDEFKEILAKYNISEGALPAPIINAASLQ